MKNEPVPIIGVIGGVGPYAGLDLARKVFDATITDHDQHHLDVLLASCPRLIPDRTQFIETGKGSNPAYGIVACMEKLAAGGAQIFGVPCNTAHSPVIFDLVETLARELLPGKKLFHLIKETVALTKKRHGSGKIGLLATRGTHHSGVYRAWFADGPFELLEPDEEGIARVHQAIFSRAWGIKAVSNPVSPKAFEVLSAEARKLQDRGAKAIIMGCTEIPLALDNSGLSLDLIDPAVCLARALVRHVAPEKLKPMD